MERFKKILLLFITVIGLFLLTGCDIFSFDFFNASQEDENVVTLAPSNNNELESASEDTGDTGTTENPGSISGDKQTITPAPTTTIQPAATVDLPIYTVNITTSVTEPITAAVPKDTAITPELIVDNVVEAMADQSLEVGINSVTTEKDAIIVDFDKNKAPLNEIGSIYEDPILDAIAMSLIDNLSDYNKVIYHVEGKAYAGSHIELEFNEPYLTR